MHPDLKYNYVSIFVIALVFQISMQRVSRSSTKNSFEIKSGIQHF